MAHIRHNAHHPLHLLCWTVLSHILGGCGLYHYMPNTHNVPLFHEQGEVRAVIGKSTYGSPHPHMLPVAIPQMMIDDQPGLDLQGAFALTDHVGLMANGFFVHDNIGTTTSRASFLEGGAGWYDAMDGHFVLEVYGTAGMGSIRERVWTHGTTNTIMLVRVSIQPGFGYTSRNLDVAVSLRISGLSFQGFRGPTDDEAGRDEDMALLDRQAPRMIMEPAVTIRFGPRSAKMQIQWGWAQNQGKPFSMVDHTFGLGLQLNINNAFRTTSSVPNGN